MDQGISVFFWEIRWNLYFEPDAFHHSGIRVVGDPFHDLHTLGGQVAFLAKTQDKDPSTCPDGGEENLKRTGCAGNRRLIRSNSEGTKVGVYSRTAGEVYDHFHFFNS